MFRQTANRQITSEISKRSDLKEVGVFVAQLTMEAMDTTTNTQSSKPRWKQMGKEEKAAAVHDEMKRINQLPATSTYATHRLRVLNKILQLMSIQRT
ncbi:hypothetical protein OIU79_026523, partial [Salix purpurea]